MKQSPAEVTKEIISGFSADTSMSEVSADRISNYYDLTGEDYKDCSLYIEGSGGFADEVAVFEAASAEKVKTIQEAAKARIERRRKDFDGYNPDELTKIDDAQVTAKGNYVLVLITDDNAAAKKTFDKAFE